MNRRLPLLPPLLPRAARRALLACALAIPAIAAVAVVPVLAQAVTEVQVTPETLRLAVGERRRVLPVAFDQQGRVLGGAAFTFLSSDTAVARVERDGTVVGVAPGLARVDVRAGGRRAAVAVLVEGMERPRETASAPPPPPPSPSSAPGSTAPLPATVLAAQPAALVLLPGERATVTLRGLRDDGGPGVLEPVRWQVQHAEVARVSRDGEVLGAAPGRTTLRALAGDLAVTIPVEVAPAELVLLPGRLELMAGGIDSLAAVVPAQGRRSLRSGLAWSSTDARVATVGPNGLVRARAPGEAIVWAEGFGQRLRAVVRVYPPVAAFVASPRPGIDTLVVPVGGALDFSATAQAVDSTPVAAPIRWMVSDTALARFDPATGTLAARGAGVVTLTAALATFPPARWTIRIAPGALVLGRERLGLAAGARRPLEPAVVAADRRFPVAHEAVTWTSEQAAVARVSAAGELEALAPGRTMVGATAAGRRAQLEVLVSGAALLVRRDRGGGLVQLAGDSLLPLPVDGVTARAAAWSPDRLRLAVAGRGPAGDGLWLADADGAAPRLVVRGFVALDHPVWTPGGDRVIFTAERDGVRRLWSFAPGDSAAVPLPATEGATGPAAVAPDGRTLAVVLLRESTPELSLIDLEDGAPHRLATPRRRDAAPVFLTDTTLAWLGDDGRSIVTQPLDGDAPAPLVTAAEPILGWAWDREAYAAWVVTRSRRDATLAVHRRDAAPEPVRTVPRDLLLLPAGVP